MSTIISPIQMDYKPLFTSPVRMKKKYQCLVCDKVHDTEDAARNCHKGPIQAFQQGVRRYPKKSFFGR
ncbi:MAG: hypothetical protein LUQ27_03205 [Methanomassiliicoccales archaeon]|nr:hypothetical protein [Methanomassiliicoccales archaeon]